MTLELLQLVREAAAATGEPEPAALSADAPTLAVADADDDFYLVGMIGGKEVGKSALINALAGAAISVVTDHGPGTDGAIAYVHASRAEAVAALLDREAAGKYRVVTHTLPHLERQVLLDLPDLDSHYEAHVLLVRRMLRHMLYPVWVTSVEKYADCRPQEMLRRVAEGNAADNFVFVLNKADQAGGEGEAVRDDYARRAAALLSLPTPPRVWVVSAAKPDQFELLALRQQLMAGRSARQVSGSIELAARRQDATLLTWLGRQPLRQRAERFDRLYRDAEDVLTNRLGGVVLERLVPTLAADAAYRQAGADEAMAARVARWPIVRLVHTLLAPLLAMASAVVRGSERADDSAAVVDRHLRQLADVPANEPAVDGLARLVQATFAHVRQAAPMVVELYPRQRPWDDDGARDAAALLRGSLALAMHRAGRDAVAVVARSREPLRAIGRFLLTVGAVIWFPFLQPLIETAMSLLPSSGVSWHQLGVRGTLFVVQVLGAAYLLRAAGFLMIWFTALWLALRWQTDRRTSRHLARVLSAGTGDASLPRVAVEWLDTLLVPLKAGRTQAAALADRVDAARRRLAASTAA